MGRDLELATLVDRLGRLGGGRGGACTLQGAAGSGKTTLLRAVSERAEADGVRVVRVGGTEAEADLPWAAVAEVVAPFAEEVAALGALRGEALRAALALAASEGPIDGLAVAFGVLEVLATAAAQRPVLVVVDDLPWIDAASRGALSFVARRLDDDPVLLLCAARVEARQPPPAAVGEVLDLGRLTDAAVREVLVAHGVRSPTARSTLAELADGNPLLAVQLAGALSAEQRLGTRPLPAAVSLPVDLDHLFRPELDKLPARGRRAVTVAAADTSGRLATVLDAVEALGGCLEDLELGEEAGILVVEGAQVGFVHPLARTAALREASGPDRRRAHASLARAEGERTPAGVLHRAAAVTGHDDELADELATLAGAALERGAPVTAAQRLVQAASTASAEPRRAELLVGAARAALAAGEAQWAAELVAAARAADALRGQALDARVVEVRLAVAQGRHGEARALAEAADAALADEDPVGVAELLVEAARPLLVEAPWEAAPLADRAVALAAAAPPPVRWYAEVLQGCVRYVLGNAEGAEAGIARWRDLLDLDGPVRAGPFLAETVVLYLGHSHHLPEARALLDEIEAAIRASCASGALIPVLGARSFLTYAVDLRESVAAGREAVELSEETGQPGLSSVAQDTLSIAAATVGDEELTARVCGRLLASGAERGEVWARAALGRLHLVHDRPDDAAEQFALLRRRIGDENRSITAFEADEAEALVRSGRADDARRLLPVLAADAEARGWWAVGQHQRILALLAADIDEAGEHFEAAREALAQTDNRIAQGVVELTWGEWLRRAKRRAEARRHLERAVELFGLVGATGFRRRAEEELVAAGGTADRSRPAEEVLGDVELQVARLAAGGTTNRGIADQLFISPRTVENHLGAVYRKLGVAGRPGLAARAASDPALRLRAPEGG